MSAEGYHRTIRTSLGVIVAAWVMGAVGGLFFGFFGGTAPGLGTSWLIAGILWGLIGATLGSGFVGLCGLLGGAELGRNFSYPLTLSLVGCLVLFAMMLLDSLGLLRGNGFLIGAIGSMGGILGVVGGGVLARRTIGFKKRSRVWGAIGAGAMLPIGGLLMYLLSGGRIGGNVTDISLLVVGALSFSVFGGALGALCGAARGRRTKRYKW